MEKVIGTLIAVVGIIHLMPVTGVIGNEQLATLYGILIDEPNLEILMRHRAVLFGLLGVFLLYAAFQPALRTLAIVAGFVRPLMGANAVSHFPAEPLRKALPFVLLFLLFYTWFQPSLGNAHAPKTINRYQQIKGILLGLIIGFYDGFFGSGTGSFLLFGFDFLHASAATKLVNVATNLAAILMLASLGQINWPLGFAMMVANIAGSHFGSRLAIKHGSAFVRKAFLMIVSAL